MDTVTGSDMAVHLAAHTALLAAQQLVACAKNTSLAVEEGIVRKLFTS